MSRWHVSSRNPVRLERDPDNRWIAGVAAGIARFFGVRPGLVRLGFVVATFFFWFPVLVYLALWIFLPRRERELVLSMDPETERFWRTVATQPTRAASDLKGRFRALDERLQQLERVVTSDSWRLKRQFRDLEQGRG